MGNSTKNWYALYTKTGCEKKVSNLLSRKNIENFCPLRRNLNSRKKVVVEPLFNSYVFVQVDTTSDMQNIRMTDSVVNFVYWLGKPAVIQDEEIEIMKRFISEYANVKIEKIPFEMDGTLRVIGVPQPDKKMAMVSVANNIVKIVLPSLGYVMFAEVEKSTVEIITASKQLFNIEGKYQYAI